MNRKREVIETNGDSVGTGQDECFPVVSICRDDLRTLFSDEQVAVLSDADMAAIADRFGDRIWVEWVIDELCEVVKPYITEAQRAVDPSVS